MNILEYTDLDVSKVRSRYEKLIGHLQRDDFSSAQVKKLPEHDLYRAKLDDADRLLFKLVTYKGERYALILEVVLNHAYDKSKFLRGVRIDESKLPLLSSAEADKPPPAPYLNPANTRFHLLDKIISFDPEQQDIYRLTPPLIIIGPAGSGKTALTLEKMKRSYGRVLYVTLSPFLADNSRNLYYAHHYENEHQEPSFLSFKEFLETLRVPEGREITYRAFATWLLRFPRQQRVADAHRLYEEFRGVITGSIVDKPWLSREEYRDLGVRQSIYLAEERETVYTLFEKYLTFLKDNGYYDPNILAHDYLKLVQQAYDFIVVDEVQDVTNIQLQLILKSLKTPGQFILCGDANQIVHPNFFSWSTLKTMLFSSAALDPQKVIRILQSNFRNSAAVIGLANRLLRIKQRRFGSIDRESASLMNSLSEKAGETVFLNDTDKVKQEVNRATRRSARFAVLVMREEEKEAARKHFETPLLFSIQEAKGLEYENVILVNFVSNERAGFQEVARGVSPEDLEGELRYMRASDKTDKSLEAYKFFVNSLYVAVTRAVQRLYVIERDTAHPLLSLLGLKNPSDRVMLDVKQSSVEDWQAEARRLELQGRQEQADEIRRGILKTQPVPWEVLTHERVRELVDRTRDPQELSQKPRKTLFDYSLFYDEPRLIELLSAQGFDKAKQIYYLKEGRRRFNRALYDQQRANLLIKDLQAYRGTSYQTILRQCEQYGIDHRTLYNTTPLMLAARAGNAALLRELLAGGADDALADNHGLTAWQSALQGATESAKYAADSFPAVHECLAPSYLSVTVDDRLLKIDGRQGEFLLFHIMFLVLRRKAGSETHAPATLTAIELATIAALLPDSVIAPYRKKRQYISALLSGNELDSANRYSKKLFMRTRIGHYRLNPKLAVRRRERWVPVDDTAADQTISSGSERGA